MNVTESVARTKHCCSGNFSFCSASECMAWRWAHPPRLEYTETISSRHVAALRKVENIAMENEAPFDAFMRESVDDPAVRACLAPKSDEWVCTSGPSYSEDDGVIQATFTRSSDDLATGYCGLCPGGRHD